MQLMGHSHRATTVPVRSVLVKAVIAIKFLIKHPFCAIGEISHITKVNPPGQETQ